MNAMDLLKEDHDRVREMFDRFRDLGEEDRAGKQRLFNRIAEALEIHAQLEERIFYPAVRSVKSEDAMEITLEAFEEHKIAETLLRQIRSLARGDARKDAKMKVLMESVEHHIEEEEDEIFGEAADLGDERLDELGDQMQSLQADLLRERGPGAELAEELAART
jgi:hemerythrin superfamily protein